MKSPMWFFLSVILRSDKEYSEAPNISEIQGFPLITEDSYLTVLASSTGTSIVDIRCT